MKTNVLLLSSLLASTSAFANGWHPGTYTVVIEDSSSREAALKVQAVDMNEAVRIAGSELANPSDLPTRVFCPDGELVWDFTDKCGLPGMSMDEDCVLPQTPPPFSEMYPSGLPDYVTANEAASNGSTAQPNAPTHSRKVRGQMPSPPASGTAQNPIIALLRWLHVIN